MLDQLRQIAAQRSGEGILATIALLIGNRRFTDADVRDIVILSRTIPSTSSEVLVDADNGCFRRVLIKPRSNYVVVTTGKNGNAASGLRVGVSDSDTWVPVPKGKILYAIGATDPVVVDLYIANFPDA